MIITIDGPAGTGKSTVARKVAEKLGFHIFDTGAMYRAVTFSAMKEKVDLSDKKKLMAFLETFHFDIRENDGAPKYFIGESDVTEAIRDPKVTKNVSEVSAKPEVREKLVDLQRGFGKGKNAVFEGRDMGSVVFPEAELKVYLTARPAVRAERRYLEVKRKFSVVDQETIMKEILERDHYDSTREISPLSQPANSHLIDTSDLTIDEVVGEIIKLVPKKKGR